jgi:3-mercaptopropionate dioxygenase
MMTTPTRPAATLSELLDGVRTAVAARASWADTAQLVAEQLRRHLPSPDVLTAQQRLGAPDGYRTHTLHVEPDGSFSIIALVWRPGQVTRIHDHVTWCTFGVIQGVEHEDLFDAELNLVGRSDNHAGDVSGFAPPATSTGSTTPPTPRRSRSTSTELTSRASARASGATTTELRQPPHGVAERLFGTQWLLLARPGSTRSRTSVACPRHQPSTPPMNSRDAPPHRLLTKNAATVPAAILVQLTHHARDRRSG